MTIEKEAMPSRTAAARKYTCALLPWPLPPTTWMDVFSRSRSLSLFHREMLVRAKECTFLATPFLGVRHQALGSALGLVGEEGMQKSRCRDPSTMSSSGSKVSGLK